MKELTKTELNQLPVGSIIIQKFIDAYANINTPKQGIDISNFLWIRGDTKWILYRYKCITPEKAHSGSVTEYWDRRRFYLLNEENFPKKFVDEILDMYGLLVEPQTFKHTLKLTLITR